MSCWDLLGVCVEKKLDLGSAVAIALGLVGLTSLYFAARQLRLGQRAQQVQIAIKLHEDFFGNQDLRNFLYRLDYSNGPRAWQFDPQKFPHSEEEQSVDLLLYKLSFIGSLVQNGDIRPVDLHWLRAEVAIILENNEILKYLEWLQSPGQIPGHASFAGAAHLYHRMFGYQGRASGALSAYLKGAQS
jgi:hypothetical protein